MRAFLAVPVPKSAKGAVSALIPALAGGSLKIVRPENYHLTLKFLGEKGDGEINQIKEALTYQTKKFTAALSGLGAFPSPQHIRVIWAGIGEGKEQYIRLQKETDTLLAPLQIRQERDYVPHLTIARVKTITDKQALQNFLQTRLTSPQFQIDSIHMMMSELTPQGPIYTKLFSIPLP